MMRTTSLAAWSAFALVLGFVIGPSLAQTLPIYFVENRGHLPEDVAFFVRGRDRVVFFERRGVTLRMTNADEASWAVKVDFPGARPSLRPEGIAPRPALFSYFGGSHSSESTGLRSFSGIRYRGVWPGIDLVYRGDRSHLKYELTVTPGTDPAQIAFRYRAVSGVDVTSDGSLRLTTPVGTHVDRAPIAWQVKDGVRRPVAVRFQVEQVPGEGGDAFTVRFALGEYDRRASLVIDPAFYIHAGYIGGAAEDQGGGVAVDAGGFVYVVGSTSSSEATFPVKGGPIKTGAVRGGFITKLDPTGTTIVYSGFLTSARGYDVAVDAAGHAYVTGFCSDGLPVKGRLDPSYNGSVDAFVLKVAPDGTSLVYCGYIGGLGRDYGSGIAIDSKNRAIIGGRTDSTENSFPVKRGPFTIHGGYYYNDGFVACVAADGSRLDYCGYLGGSSSDAVWGVDVDANDDVYLGGDTVSSNFPTVRGPQTVRRGYTDGFVCKLIADGSRLAYCGFVGGAASDAVTGVRVDGKGRLYIAGSTGSDELSFPVRGGPYLTYQSGGDAFVGRVNASGSGYDFLGYIGGNQGEGADDLALDASDRAYVVGTTRSPETSFPVFRGPQLKKPKTNSDVDVFVARVAVDGTGLEYAGYVGGAQEESAGGIAVDRDGNAVIVGSSKSDETSFPVVAGPDLTHNSPYNFDAFVARVALVATDGPATASIGATALLRFTATSDVGFSFRAASSFGTGPIPIDTRTLALSPDSLFIVSLLDIWPFVFVGYSGRIPPGGESPAEIRVPSIPALIGLKVHTAFITLSGQAPSGVRSIADTHTLTITA